MVAAVLPDEDKTRVKTPQAHSGLASPNNPNLDSLVALAADLFKVPVVALSLIDGERQWLASAVGIDIDCAEREITMCAHAILMPHDVMVVENASRDPRFRNIPLAVRPLNSFYAGAPILGDNGQPLGVLCIADKTPRQLDFAGQRHLANLAAAVGAMLELHRKNRSLYSAAHHDWLTGVCNRRGFEAALITALNGTAEPNCALMMLDLNGFKAVNDTFGHDAGDSLLREVAMRLSANARPSDLIARLGGDEFAVLIDGPLDIESARGVAIRYMTALSRHHMFLDHPIPIGASIGVAVAPIHGVCADDLIRAADQSLYFAKRSGLQIAVSGHDAAEAPDRSSAEIDKTLQTALRDGDLTIVWRPLHGLGRPEMFGRQALAEWKATARETDSAADGPAKSTVTPGTWLLDFACEHATSWQDRLPVIVNISSDWLITSDLTAVVREALRRHGLPPERLILQISEHSLGFDRHRVVERIAALQSLGVTFMLSEFGTGSGSLVLLQELPIDIVKPDERFVASLGLNAKAEAIAAALITLCHDLDIRVCATGVETAAQLDFLRLARCDYAQGAFLDARFLLPDVNAPLLNVA
jgi:diguanylate cyclase (GGDEF)-like protein